MSTVISLPEAKAWLQIAHQAQDLVIQNLIAAAEDYVARECGVILGAETVTEDLDGGDYLLRLAKHPVASVTSVTDSVAGGTWPNKLMMDGTLRRADDDGNLLTALWPAGFQRFRVVYSAGYARAIPAGLRQAILMLLSRAYQARSGETGGSGAGVGVQWGRLADSDIRALLTPYRRRAVASV
jgi:uncharacterized phiE125 gp8 family phage protein